MRNAGEEIDNGVHPSRADNLVKQIREIALERKLRVLITSHNPALLDAVSSHAKLITQIKN
ncbi:hypothetical protein myaer102_21110 [Microcystis viridis NIES-102]|uniref:ATPase AAA-type core domain-containing protein n=1 Tax=Microcystis viridis NIES-102 TaxID=213615 RepID=A0A3G9JUM2_MICVR|nr:AAA family ATPase [Microcystis viridis]BBH39577.1 hypothetical protein myaer102_21110 [Microcystis viridis NIES-102]